MARCASDSCQRWCPEVLARHGAGTSIGGQWFCSEACVERMARRLLTPRPPATGVAAAPPLRLGVLLRHAGAVSAADLTSALIAQRQTGLRLGAQLREMDLVDAKSILRALAAQAGVSYLATLDPQCVREAPGRLSPQAVRALGLVPFSDPDLGRVRIAMVAPVPRAAINALRHLTGWTPEPYLVTDENFDALLENYGAALTGRSLSGALVELIHAHSLSDAAARIASAATSVRRTTVTEAHWDPYTLVRVQGEGLTRDVLLSHADNKEMPCLAASTSH